MTLNIKLKKILKQIGILLLKVLMVLILKPVVMFIVIYVNGGFR